MNSNDNKYKAVIECKQLTKIYKGLLTGRSKAVCALKNISLSVHKGQSAERQGNHKFIPGSLQDFHSAAVPGQGNDPGTRFLGQLDGSILDLL